MNVLIVDDEVNARRKVRQYLGTFEPGRVRECADVPCAVDAIRQDPPDVLLLDVQLRDGTAFDIVAAIGPDHMPPTIFATAYDEHAIRAFELNAIDYLLKPFSRARFEQAVQRLLERSPADADAQRRGGMRALGRSASAATGLRWILVRLMDGSSELVRVRDIEWLEAAGNYVRLHRGKRDVLHRHTLSALVDQLDPHLFVRVHRSAAVNLEFVERISPLAGGDYTIHLRSGAKVRLSRHYREHFEEALGSGGDRPGRVGKSTPRT